MNLRFAACLLSFVLVVGCKKARPPTDVATHGSVHAVHHGDVAPTVSLTELGPAKDVVAVGALSELRGEVTIVDGKVWLAYSREDGTTRVESHDASDEKAAMLVSARVPQWQSVTMPRDVSDLDAELPKLALEHGLDPEQPFPFVIEGTAKDLSFHVIQGPQHRHIETKLPVARATFVGFYSARHGGVFTHMGQKTHVHVVLKEEQGTGHVDAATIRAGATLKLPSRS